VTHALIERLLGKGGSPSRGEGTKGYASGA